ncbi:MAG TPA: hypothetical protein VK629_07485 [Steroidobacteraceae bacterium]|nr:hypothetical protein [Steroidobacteraceae bacterium]
MDKQTESELALFRTHLKTNPTPNRKELSLADAKRPDSPTSKLKRYTIIRDGDRALEFDGEVLAEVEMDGAGPGAMERVHRAAVYCTKGGRLIAEFSSRNRPGFAHFVAGSDFDEDVRSKAAAFANINEAIAWFRPGRLTIELLKKLGHWNPEFIE